MKEQLRPHPVICSYMDRECHCANTTLQSLRQANSGSTRDAGCAEADHERVGRFR